MKTGDVLLIGGGALLLYLLYKNSSYAVAPVVPAPAAPLPVTTASNPLPISPAVQNPQSNRVTTPAVAPVQSVQPVTPKPVAAQVITNLSAPGGGGGGRPAAHPVAPPVSNMAIPSIDQLITQNIASGQAEAQQMAQNENLSGLVG